MFMMLCFILAQRDYVAGKRFQCVASSGVTYIGLDCIYLTKTQFQNSIFD